MLLSLAGRDTILIRRLASALLAALLSVPFAAATAYAE
ncbi:MAG: hypothetical protein QOD06_3350, partial [Candidatus Binatota bacterium]|nr:hypothetical protein [Candidatus Binatota bacterium]